MLNASATYTRIAPVATVHFEELDLSLDPKNNYNAGVSLNQLIYDFGKNRPKIEAAREKEGLSRLQQEQLYQSLALNTVQLYYMNCFTRQAIRIKRAYNPSLDLSAAAGGKNGYPIHIDRMKLNYEVGVTLSVPLYEGGRRKQSASLARSAYNTASFQKELVQKQVKQQVSENQNTLMSDFNKIEQLSRQVTLAQQAYEQAKVNYKAGTVTNLELLTSSTNLSGSRLQLLQSKINYLVSYYKLQVSIGERIW